MASVTEDGGTCSPVALKQPACAGGSRAVTPGRPRSILSRQRLAAPECDSVIGGATADVKGGERDSVAEEGGEAGLSHVDLGVDEELNATAGDTEATAEDAAPSQPQPPQPQQVHFPRGSGRSRDYRITVPRKDVCGLIGEHPKLPLEVVLRISIQGVIQEEEQRVRRG